MENSNDPIITYRKIVTDKDRETVRRITASTGFFTEAEVAIAGELIDECLEKGVQSGYFFLFAEIDQKPLGYTCFGPIGCTVSSYDLYWIVVAAQARGKKIGTGLLAESEKEIKLSGGTRVYVETSEKPLYEPTRVFYRRRGYSQEAILRDFYAPGDSKVIYVKAL